MRTLAATLLALVVSCTPEMYAKGTWHFDGTSFGKRDSPNPEGNPDLTYHCSPGDQAGTLRVELAIAYLGRGAHEFAYVTFAPLDEHRPVDVSMPSSHVVFARGDCSSYVSNVSPQPTDAQRQANGYRKLSGDVQLACAKDGNSLALNLSYACVMREN